MATNGTINGSCPTSSGSEANFIPIIDFSPFLDESHPDRAKTAFSILSAFTKSGFIYLKNHGISDAILNRTFAHSASFFARPQSDKDALGWTSASANRGYTCIGREKVSQSLDASTVKAERESQGEDLKESFEIGDDRPGPNNEDRRTPYPADAQGQIFKEECSEFHDTCAKLHMKVMRAIALGLGIDEHWFDSYTSMHNNTLRLLHYPPVKKSVFQLKKGQVRAGAHSDYGSITLLFQDSRGGLQVQGPHGTWVNATPIPGTIVINAGDLLQRWSNDLIRSTLHRVVEPPPLEGQGEDGGDVEYPARYSIAYFCNPNFDRMIEVIPNILKEGEVRKYEGVNSFEYLVGRLQATY